MDQEKMIMGEPPDEEVKSGKGGTVTIIFIVCVLVAVGFFYFKNKSNPVEIEQSAKVVQSVQKIEDEINQPIAVESQKISDSIKKKLVKDKEDVVAVQEREIDPQKAAQEDLSESSSIKQQPIGLNTVSSSSTKAELPANIKSHQSPLVKSNNESDTGKNDLIEKEPSVASLQRKEKNQTGLIENSVIKIDGEKHLPLENIKDGSKSTSDIFIASKKNTSMEEKTFKKNIQEQLVPPLVKKSLTVWTVKAGEYLWMIAEDPRIFGDPHKWKTIYEANKDQILNADFIYPGQKLIIPN